MQRPTSTDNVQRLCDFRQAFYDDCLLRGRDAFFELGDAVLTSRTISSFAELSQATMFRRQWPSLYEALDDAVLDEQRLLRLLGEQLQAATTGSTKDILIGGDHTPWPREGAYTLEHRRFLHSATRVPGNRPITIGLAYSTIGWVRDMARDSWCLPLLHERIAPSLTALQATAGQLRRVLAERGRDAERVVFLGDSEYGSASFLQEIADLSCRAIFRLRANRVFYQPAPAYSGRGRPCKHGAKFTLKQPESWSQPVEDQTIKDPQYGTTRLRRFAGLHFRDLPSESIDLVLVEQFRADDTFKRSMWLMVTGRPTIPTEMVWRYYLRRFAIEHWYRFAKQRLHWTRPRLATAEGSDRWSALMPVLQWQLYLARPIGPDAPLPWQKPQKLRTPGRVAEGFGGILAGITTPACTPKPRGKSPGCPPGRPRARRTQYPILRKTSAQWNAAP